MNDLIKVNYDTEQPTVSGRELHEALKVETPYHKWFPRMCEYGFMEGADYVTEDKNVRRADGAVMPQTQHDHKITIPMAKELCMIQRNERGKMFRQYFISVEEKWNSPEMVMARALQFSNKKIVALENNIKELQEKAEYNKPKVIFANAVEAAKTSILIGDLAKILKQNGCNTGQKRLFEQLRQEGFLMKGGSSHNMPTQRAMEMGLFEVKESTVNNPDGSIRINRTTKVTGKGQTYFINRFLGATEVSEKCQK